jgi:hypothetical protein
MLSGVIDELPGRITANADTKQMDADDEPPPSPLISLATANSKEAHDDDNAAGVAVDVH